MFRNIWWFIQDFGILLLDQEFSYWWSNYITICLIMLLLKSFLKLRCFGKFFLLSFKNCLLIFVIKRSLFGALTFIFLLFLSICCSIKFKVTLTLLSYIHIHFHIHICIHMCACVCEKFMRNSVKYLRQDSNYAFVIKKIFTSFQITLLTQSLS